MQRFIKQSILESANSPVKIAKLNFQMHMFICNPADIDVGFAASGTLAGLLRQKKVSDL